MMFSVVSSTILSALCLSHAVYGLYIDVSSNGHVGIDVELNQNYEVQHHPLGESEKTPRPSAYDPKDYVVEVDTGKWQGHLSDDGFYVKFSNLPYAAPPNDSDNRFLPPAYPNHVEGLRDDTSTRKCPQAIPGWASQSLEFLKEFGGSGQGNTLSSKWKTPITPDSYGSVPDQEGDEDCLYLDVYVPKKIWENRNQREFLKPAVAVWIHGGGFVTGSKDDIKSPEGLFKAANATEEQNIIFISINYRLGLFGWLGGDKYMEDWGVPNLGLLDQAMALEWIQRSIYLFGGDHRRITAMGQDAGAVSILHLITRNRYYVPAFNGAIIQSPGFFPQLNNTVDDTVYKEVLAKANVTNMEELANVTATKLRDINTKLVFNSTYGQFKFGITVDGISVRATPAQTFATGDFHRKIPVLTGYTGLDALAFTPPWIRDIDGLKKHIRTLFTGVQDETLKKIADMYKVPSDSNGGLAQRAQVAAVSNVLNDVATRCNVYAHSKALAKDNYEDYSFRYVFGAELSVRGGDLNYVFYPQTPSDLVGQYSRNDTLANKTQQAWVDFIRYRDPNPENVQDWPIYSDESRKVGMFGHMQKFVPHKQPDFNFTVEDDPMTDDMRSACDFWIPAPYYDPGKKSTGFVLQNEL